MFVPKKFKQENIEDLVALMKRYPFATLITRSVSELEATHLPMIVEKRSQEHYLIAHIAKANPLWKVVQNASDVLVTFNGPNCYISPNNYPTKKQTGKAVPTWNYVVVHVKGIISFIQDPAWILNAIERLTTIHESDQKDPWSIEDAPDEYIQKLLSAVVGIEIKVSSITGQWKLSQNQPEVNQRGIVDALSANRVQAISDIASMINANYEQREN
ncbi:FMN-binding negative transcriptional regulator [Aliiglaciecola litoralis]|uniref:FMN-binding negative transcriptional regulator n=1 Tax=Aliiglaciecola litoralis TaxID=582857 RepID=A0ABN1LBP8_9ALTE